MVLIVAVATDHEGLLVCRFFGAPVSVTGAWGAGVAGSLLPGDSAPGSCQLVTMVLWTYTLS